LEEESLKETNSYSLTNYTNKDDNNLISTNDSGTESSTFNNNKNITFKSTGLLNLKKSEANETTSPTKKIKTNEQHNLQLKVNDEFTKTASNVKSPMKTSNLMTESKGSLYLNHSLSPFTVDSLFNKFNNENSSNSSIPPITCNPTSSSEPNQTALFNVSNTINSKSNQTNNFESFLNNKLLIEKQFSQLSSTTSNPFEYMNKLMEFFQQQQNVLNTSGKNTTKNNNSTSPTSKNTFAELKLAKTPPYQNISNPNATSNSNKIHKQQLKFNTETSSPHFQSFGTLPTPLNQSSLLNSEFHSKLQEYNPRLLSSYNSNNHQYWIPSSNGYEPNTNYSEFSKLANPVKSSSALINKSKSTSLSLSNEYHSQSPQSVPFSPLLLYEHQQQQSYLPSSFNTVLLNQHKHNITNLSPKNSNLTNPTSTNSYSSHSANFISIESSISPHCINQKHSVSSEIDKTPKLTSTCSISSQPSNQNGLISNSIEGFDFVNQHNKEKNLKKSYLFSASNNNQNHYSPLNNQSLESSPPNVSSLTKNNLNSNSLPSSNSNNCLLNCSLPSSIESNLFSQNR